MNTQTVWRSGLVNNYKTALDKKFRISGGQL